MGRLQEVQLAFRIHILILHILLTQHSLPADLSTLEAIKNDTYYYRVKIGHGIHAKKTDREKIKTIRPNERPDSVLEY